MGTSMNQPEPEILETYFHSYEDLEVHRLMLSDKPRLKAYKNAIFSLKDKFKDKIVMDVGAGTGILSVFCAQAGAKKVYAVEASNLANLASEVVKENNFENKIQVIEEKVENLSLDKIGKVDIIISEWMGFYLVHEGMLDSVIAARDLFLKEGGLMLPNIARLYVAPCQLPSYYEFWDDIFGVSMKSVGENYRNCKSLKPEILQISKEDLLADSNLVTWLDLTSISKDELLSLAGQQTISVCNKPGKCQGFSIWFEVEFPDNTVLSTAPWEEPTHWKQTIIVLPNTIDISEDEPLAYEIKFEKDANDCRRYNVSLVMLDATEAEHDIPCNCYMTKCIVTKTYIQNHNDMNE